MGSASSKLLDAASKGDLDKVKRAVAKGADPAYRDYLRERDFLTYGTCRSSSGNAIEHASHYNHLPVVEYLLSLPGDHAADVDEFRHTALIFAAKKRQP